MKPRHVAALDTVESGQPFLLPGTPGLTARNARASRRALDETAQSRSTRQDREAVRQSAEREAPLPAQMCRRRTGSEEHERLPRSFTGPVKKTVGASKRKFRKKRNRGASANRDSASQIALTTHETLGPSVKRPSAFARLGEVCRIRCARPRVKFPPDV